jgi:hypothetical protein
VFHIGVGWQHPFLRTLLAVETGLLAFADPANRHSIHEEENTCDRVVSNLIVGMVRVDKGNHSAAGPFGGGISGGSSSTASG